MYAKFLHGDPLMVDHTPGPAVAAGDVVVVGSYGRVAHLDIAAGDLGALAIEGGVYTVPKATGASSAIAAGKKVYWDATAKVVTDISTSNTPFGQTVLASVDGDATTTVLHDPAY